MTLQVFPVLHFRDPATTLEQADLAHDAGADGVFVISHRGADEEVVRVAEHLRQRFPQGFQVGINLLSRSASQACWAALASKLDMVWADHMGVGSGGLSDEGRRLSTLAKTHPALKLYASVAMTSSRH